MTIIEKIFRKISLYKDAVKAIIRNKIAFHLYKILLKRTTKPDKEDQIKFQPIWIVGMYRSGTSLTCALMKKIGIDFGPFSHFLQPKGKLKHLNPKGFYENYLFADIARFIYAKLNAHGYAPPTLDQVNNFDWNAIDENEFLKFSLLEINDERISLLNKYLILRDYSPHNLHSYLRDKFKQPCAIKVPQNSLLTSLLLKKWPDSNFVIVFREPDSVIKSSVQLSDKFNYQVYIDHYLPLLELSKTNKNVIFFSYDHLLSDPQTSTKKLINALQPFSNKKLKVCSNIVDEKLYRNKVSDKAINNWPKDLSDLYKQLLEKACNIK